MAKPRTDDVLGFLSLIWEVDHELRRVSKQMQQRIGVSGPQRLVLRSLGRAKSLAAGELAEELHLHPSSITGLIARLEADGLIKRERDPSDGRRHRLKLTARGRALDVEAPGTVEDAARRALARVGPRTQREGAKLLEALAAALRELQDDDR